MNGKSYTLSEKKILEYWRDSLQDAILMSPEIKDNYQVELEALLQGSIETSIAESISKEAQRRGKTSRNEQNSKSERLPESVDPRSRGLNAPTVFVC